METAERNATTRMGAMLAAAAILLTSCSPDDGAETSSPEPEGQSDQPSPEPAETEDGAEGDDDAEPDDADAGQDDDAPVTVSETFFTGNTSLDEVTFEVEIGPLVRDGDLAALHMEFDYLEGDSRLSTRTFLHGLVGITDSSDAGGQVRILDPEALTVAEIARTDDTIAAHGSRGAVGDTLSWLGFFGAPQGDSVAVLMPHFGVIPDIPVIDGDVSDVAASDDSLQTFDDYGDITAETHELVTWRETPHYAVDVEGEETTVSLPSDVLFDVDSAELSGDADEALQAAASEMEGTQGGELSVIGHTDDVLDEEYNQELSEERAEAVHERLAELTDLGAFDEITVSGESFREPIAENSTDEGRAMNRRVELHFTTVTEPGEHIIDGELPEPEGPVAAADEPLTVTSDDGEEATLTVESLERVGGLVVAGIRVEPGEETRDLGWSLTTGIGGAGVLSQIGAVDLPHLAAGDQWVHPLRYFPDEVEIDEDNVEEADVARSDYRVLADALFGGTSSWEPGQSAVAYLIYPDIGADELTLDSPAEHEGHSQLARTVGVTPWRFEDVPVAEAGPEADAD